MDFGLPTIIRESLSSLPFFIVIIMISIVILVNGLGDTPNAIATCVSTRTLPPKKAIIISSIFLFIGMIIMTTFSLKVANTMIHLVTFQGEENRIIIGIIGALISIILWMIITNKFAIPTSESHAIIASLTGSFIAFYNSWNIINKEEWAKVLLGIFISIVAGFIVAYILTKIVETIGKEFDRRKTIKGFKAAQITGVAAMSFMHGGIVGQKFIGLFMLAVVFMRGEQLTEITTTPLWLILYTTVLMTIGTIIGGYKVIKTVGMKMSNLELYQGAISDIATALCLSIACLLGCPISTSHTKSLSIVGVSATRRISSINFKIIKNVLLAGIITFPCCGIISYLITKILIGIL